VAKNPNAWVAHNNLGFELRQSGKLSEAKEHFEEAIRINPDDAMAHYNLGIVLEQNGRARRPSCIISRPCEAGRITRMHTAT